MARRAGGRIAVVVPVLERPTAVLDALDSVRAQRRAPDALVIVDDGSGDATPESVRRWLEGVKLPFPARLLTERHRGVSAARNRGVSAAGAVDWIAFLDSDDLWARGSSGGAPRRPRGVSQGGGVHL